jgi:hypothetical protein
MPGSWPLRRPRSRARPSPRRARGPQSKCWRPSSGRKGRGHRSDVWDSIHSVAVASVRFCCLTILSLTSGRVRASGNRRHVRLLRDERQQLCGNRVIAYGRHNIMHVGGRTLQVCGQVGLESRLAIDRVEAEQSRQTLAYCRVGVGPLETGLPPGRRPRPAWDAHA